MYKRQVWANAGNKPLGLYVEALQKSLRLAHLVTRRHDAGAQVFVSLEHHWRSPNPRIFGARDLLETLLQWGRTEGDFEWAIAHHPYPQSLFEPKVWRDDQPTFAFDTPKITYKNIEVLTAWAARPEVRFANRPRVIYLTEQGLNSRDYSETALREQAAGMAYAWNKIKNLDGIEAHLYHNWVDNRAEGGLRIGLRRFPDDAEFPSGKKPVWSVYQALDTPAEAEATAFALPMVGVKSWDEVRYRGAIK